MISWTQIINQTKKIAPLSLLIAITSLHFFINLSSIRLDFLDEIIYLRQGIGSLSDFDSQWSPLYSFFYKIISLFIEDRLPIFFVAKFISTCALFPLAIFFFTKRLTAKTITSLSIALFFYLTHTNIEAGPWIHIFNISLIFINFLLFFKPDSPRRMLIFSFFMGIFIHVRMENIMTFVALIFLTFLYLIFKSTIKKSLLFLGIVLIGGLIGYFAINWPNGRPLRIEKSRTIKALEDHYIWRNGKTTATIDDFFEKYPKATTIVDFIVSYPEDFKNHALHNIREIFPRALETLKLKGRSGPYSWIILFAVIVVLSYGHNFTNLKDPYAWLFLISFSLQAFILSTLLQPWLTYIFPLGITCFFIALLIGALFFKKFSRPVVFGSFVPFLFLFYVVYNLGEDWNKRSFKNTEMKLIEQLRSMDLREDDVILFGNLMPLYAKTEKSPKVLLIFEFLSKNQDGFKTYNEWVNFKKVSVFCESSEYVLPLWLAINNPYNEFRENLKNYNFVEMPKSTDLLRCYSKR
jgi:hypothetical protein